jgi:hypothetical protein
MGYEQCAGPPGARNRPHLGAYRWTDLGKAVFISSRLFKFFCSVIIPGGTPERLECF